MDIPLNLCPTAKPVKTVYDLPESDVIARTAKLGIISALAWDYADTILDISAQMRIQQTKKLCRAVREIRGEHDAYVRKSIPHRGIAEILSLAESFSDLCADHLNRLAYAVGADKTVAGLDREHMMLVKAVQMAMTANDAVRMFSDRFDRWLRAHGVNGNTVYPKEFRRLCILLPQFAGDCYNPRLPARKITATVLVNELERIEINIHD